jgi:hypothetical protein
VQSKMAQQSDDTVSHRRSGLNETVVSPRKNDTVSDEKDYERGDAKPNVRRREDPDKSVGNADAAAEIDWAYVFHSLAEEHVPYGAENDHEHDHQDRFESKAVGVLLGIQEFEFFAARGSISELFFE